MSYGKHPHLFSVLSLCLIVGLGIPFGGSHAIAGDQTTVGATEVATSDCPPLADYDFYPLSAEGALDVEAVRSAALAFSTCVSADPLDRMMLSAVTLAHVEAAREHVEALENSPSRSSSWCVLRKDIEALRTSLRRDAASMNWTDLEPTMLQVAFPISEDCTRTSMPRGRCAKNMAINLGIAESLHFHQRVAFIRDFIELDGGLKPSDEGAIRRVVTQR
ncbi:MAG: hypothetical protein WBG08_12530 [Litorimonas sp.]